MLQSCSWTSPTFLPKEVPRHFLSFLKGGYLARLHQAHRRLHEVSTISASHLRKTTLFEVCLLLSAGITWGDDRLLMLQKPCRRDGLRASRPINDSLIDASEQHFEKFPASSQNFLFVAGFSFRYWKDQKKASSVRAVVIQLPEIPPNAVSRCATSFPFSSFISNLL